MFDASGNQQVVIDSASRVTTTWDYENQPTRYNQPANLTYPIVTMAYNADNQRVQKQSPVGTTKFLWDQQNYLAEADGSNVIQTVYTNEPQQFGNLISTRLGTTTYYHQYDALGSTRRLSDSTGSLTGDLSIYDAWGNVVARTGTTVMFFQWIGELGYYYDTETGLLSVRVRPYGPTIGRWTSQDPLLFFAGSNLYLYVLNRPAFSVDPSGLDVYLTSKVNGYTVGYRITKGHPSDNKWPNDPDEAGEWGQAASATSGSYSCCVRTTVNMTGGNVCNTLNGEEPPGRSARNAGRIRVSIRLPPGCYTVLWLWEVSATGNAQSGHASLNALTPTTKTILSSVLLKPGYHNAGIENTLVIVKQNSPEHGTIVKIADYDPILSRSEGESSSSKYSSATGMIKILQIKRI